MTETISYAVFWSTKNSDNEYCSRWYDLHEEAQLKYDCIRKNPHCGKVRMVRRVEQLEVVQQDW